MKLIFLCLVISWQRKCPRKISRFLEHKQDGFLEKIKGQVHLCQIIDVIDVVTKDETQLNQLYYALILFIVFFNYEKKRTNIKIYI